MNAMIITHLISYPQFNIWNISYITSEPWKVDRFAATWIFNQCQKYFEMTRKSISIFGANKMIQMLLFTQGFLSNSLETDLSELWELKLPWEFFWNIEEIFKKAKVFY